VNTLKQLWLTLRSNPYVVAFEGGFYGAAVNFISEAVMNGGKVDVTKAGLEKLLSFAIAGGIAAVRLLLRPAPGSTPNQSK
jgi:hypothetical protein